MKLFVLASTVPRGRHDRPGVTAVNVVVNELVSSLAQLGHGIDLQVVFGTHRREARLSEDEQADLDAFARQGMGVLAPIFPAAYVHHAGGRLGRLARLALRRVRIEDVYPAAALRDIVRARITASGADAILTIWSQEGVAATHGFHAVPRIAYHGDVDFAPAEARERDGDLFFGTRRGDTSGPARRAVMTMRRRLGLAEWRHGHRALMRDLDVIANVTASNVGVYAEDGHRRSVPIRNTWFDPGVQTTLTAPERRPVKIIGHVGYLDRTGSVYGLRFLLRDLLPALEAQMGDLAYEVHVIGGGELPPALRAYARHPRVIMRGFVNDLDAELNDSDMLLLLNNAGPYQAAFTRHVVAWAMGLCLVVHENSMRAVPEIVPFENAFVGGTAPELATLIHLAATSADASERVRKGGRATYERLFLPGVVADSLAAEISRAVAARRRPAAAERPDHGVRG